MPLPLPSGSCRYSGYVREYAPYVKSDLAAQLPMCVVNVFKYDSIIVLVLPRLD